MYLQVLEISDRDATHPESCSTYVLESVSASNNGRPSVRKYSGATDPLPQGLIDYQNKMYTYASLVICT